MWRKGKSITEFGNVEDAQNFILSLINKQIYNFKLKEKYRRKTDSSVFVVEIHNPSDWTYEKIAEIICEENREVFNIPPNEIESEKDGKNMVD